MFNQRRCLISLCMVLAMVAGLLIIAIQNAEAADVKLAWDASSPTPNGYKVYYGTASQNYPSSLDVGNQTTAVIPNLSPGVKHYMVVRSYTSAVESGPSNEVRTFLVSNANVTAITATAATVNWTTDEAGDSQVAYGASASYGSTSALNSSSVSAHSVNLSGLTPSTLYHYKVMSKDASGNATLVDDYTFTTAAPAEASAPTVPAGLAATVASSSQINLSWSASTDNVGVTGYWVYRNGTQIAATAVTAYSDSGLTASTAYSYTVAAYDAAGNVSAQSAVASATTNSSSDTQAPVISNIGSSQITRNSASISWNTDKDSDSQVEYGTTISYGSLISVNSGMGPTHSISLTGLVGGTTYHFRVKSKDAAGNLATSADGTFTTLLPPPPNVKVN